MDNQKQANVALTVLFMALTMTALPAQGQLSRELAFQENPSPVTLTDRGLRVTANPLRPNSEGLAQTRLVVLAPGYKKAIFRAGAAPSHSYPQYLALLPLSTQDPLPSVLYQSYTGGAHCCTTLTVIVPLAGTFRQVEFEPIDGEPDPVPPRDIDGDGSVDFIRSDDSFSYQFSSGAGSISPPRIFNIIEGQVTDVSGRAGFRSLWQDFAARTLRGCSDMGNSDRNGACAAYVVAGIRLGSYDAFMKRAAELANRNAPLPTFCKTPVADYGCPAGQEISFTRFDRALSYFLKRQGYIN